MPRNTSHEPDERAPLLRKDTSPPATPELDHGAPPVSHRNKKLYATSVTFSIVFFYVLGELMQMGPRTRIFESIYCHQYYADHDPSVIGDDGWSVPEDVCNRNGKVQDQVASLKGWQMLFDGIPSIILAVPYGALADKYGRKPFVFLNLLGLFLQSISISTICYFPAVFPIHLVWLSSAFFVLGGGPTVLIALVYSVLADSVPWDERASTFFRLQAAQLVAEIIGPSIGSALMSHDLWLPVYVGLTLDAITVFSTLIALPETLNARLADPELESVEVFSDSASSSDSSNGFGALIRRNIRDLAQNFKSALDFVAHNITVSLLVFTFLSHVISRSAMEVLFQYVPHRFGWSISEVGYLFSLRAVAHIVLLLGILPAVSHFLITKAAADIRKKDLVISKASVVLCAVGAYLIGLAPTAVLATISLVIYTLGGGFHAVARSLVTSLVEPHHVGRLYTAISILDNLGSLIAGPLLSIFFRFGIKLGGFWQGLPFFGLGLMFTFVAAAVWCVRLPGPGEDPAVEADPTHDAHASP
ncbi:MAG: hypothetical protein M4579_006129 [Chaenotheca gracillima]|nr:MAG: hypothetical protein M4579_006129 [Chaenotheca gracillima]